MQGALALFGFMLSDTYFKIIENKKDIIRLYILQIVVIIFVYFSYVLS